MTNRALVLAALADGPSTVRRPLRSRDTALMRSAVESLGASVDHDGIDFRVAPRAATRPDVHVDCGLSGTVMRFVPPLAALGEATVTFDGDLEARRRPMAPLAQALRDLGVDVTTGPHGTLPWSLRGTGVARGGVVRIDASTSSQFVSALLLSGARYVEGVTVHNIGRLVPNRPHVDLTVAMLRRHGVAVTADANMWAVARSTVRAVDWTVEPDLSNAAVFMAAAVLTGGTVRLPQLGRDCVQPVSRVRDVMEAFGASTCVDGDGLSVRGPGTVRGVDLDLRDLGELTPTVASMALLASRPSRIRGVGYVRGHETDRLAALAREAAVLGGEITVDDDGLTVHPRPLHGGSWSTYHDHRMATAGALIGLVVPGVHVRDVATTAKTLPDFPGLWLQMVGAPAA